MAKSCPFATEAEMVTCWLAALAASARGKDWTVYPETAGWDLLLVHREGYQLGLEAKLSLNVKVIAQALDGADSWWREDGPDYRGVLVPGVGGVQLDLAPLCRALGLGIVRVHPAERHVTRSIALPDEDSWASREWPCWLPQERCTLPDYVPDVAAGLKSPVMLTPWKVKAIKLAILLERRGRVTRGDMKALEISPTRWTDPWNGLLAADRGAGGFVRCGRTPDFRAQHPVNYAEIEADFEKWCPPGYRFEAEAAAAARRA